MPFDVVDQLTLFAKLLVADVTHQGHVAVGLLLVLFQVRDGVVLQGGVVGAKGARENAGSAGFLCLVSQQVLVVSGFALEAPDAFGALVFFGQISL